MSRYRGIPLLPRVGGRFRRCWVDIVVGRRHGRSLCTSRNSNLNKALEPAPPEAGAASGGGMTRKEAYGKIHNLDLMTAAKILFTAPPKEKNFGLDFHLVQLFFVCMPSLAVFLVAQYARYEIRRMEAEVELKKQAEEQEKAKQAEEEAKEKDEPDRELVKVKVRLEALEEAVKEISDETKRISQGNLTKAQKGEKKEPVPVAKK